MDTGKPLYSNSMLFRLVWPMMVEQLLSVLVGMVDVLMVATLGECAVSGVSLVDSINILLIQVVTALAAGGAVVCSRYLGAKDKNGANNSAAQLMLLTVVSSAAIMLVCLISNRPLLKLLYPGVEAEVMNNAVIYFRYTAMSFPFLALYNSGAALYRSMGDSKAGMRVSMIMNAFNVAGNALCIFALKMGVAGVAVPTLLSRILAAVLISYPLFRKTSEISITSLRDLKPCGSIIREIARIGVPNGVENGIFQFGKLILSRLVSTLGTPSIAAFAVAGNLVTFLYLPGNTLGLAILTVAGHCIGAGSPEQAKHYTRKLMIVNYAMLAVLAGALGAGRYFFAGLYNLTDESLTYAARLLLIHSVGMILWPPAFYLTNTLRAGYDARFTMLVSISVMWIFRVGGAYLFVKGFGMDVTGVWYAMMMDWVVRFIIFPLRFRSFTKRVKAHEAV